MAVNDRLLRSAGWFAYVGCVVSLVQIALLVLFFARGEPFGTLNDGFIVVQYVLALPVVLALHHLLRQPGQKISTVALVLGIAGILAIVILQILLLADVLTFDQQVGPVSAALFLLFGGWLLITGYLGRSRQDLPHSMLICFVGWTYVGYPIWAFWLGRRLVASSNRTPA